MDVVISTPYILAHLWNLVSQRTYWNEYTHFTNKLPNTEEVKKFTIYYWVLPSAKAIGEAKFLSGNAIGFLSGLKDILESLSRSLRDLEVAIDWVWSNTSIEF